MILSNGAMGALRSVHDGMLSDACVRLSYVAGTSGYGYGPSTYTTASASTSCLVTAKAQPERLENTQVRNGDVEIHLPLTMTITNLDRLRVTHLHGDALTTPQTYEIVEGPQVTHVGVFVVGRLVTDGSE